MAHHLHFECKHFVWNIEFTTSKFKKKKKKNEMSFSWVINRERI